MHSYILNVRFSDVSWLPPLDLQGLGAELQKLAILGLKVRSEKSKSGFSQFGITAANPN